MVESAACLRGRRGEAGEGRHHPTQRRVIGHDFKLALPQINKTRGQRLNLGLVFAGRFTVAILLIHGRNITQPGAIVSYDASQH